MEVTLIWVIPSNLLRNLASLEPMHMDRVTITHLTEGIGNFTEAY